MSSSFRSLMAFALIIFLAPSGFSAPDSITASAKISAIDVSVDPRVELISIIFRLAGNPEYGRGAVRVYNRDIEQQFRPFTSHPAVRLAATLRRTRGVSFDAPMGLAVRIADPYTMKMRMTFSPLPEGLDSRWPQKETLEFLDKARQFADETKFADFIARHQRFYDEATSRMKTLLDQEFHLDWFERFFGARPGAQFHIALAMLNGPNNYGAQVKIGGVDDLYCILGVSQTDWLGMPRFTRAILPTVVHEFCHSYANPLVDKHAAQLAKAGQAIFPRVKVRMERMAYVNWNTMMRESVVRACVIRYMATENPPAAEKQVQEEQRRGFLWMKELADLLAKYESDRQTYPTLDKFFPQIVEFFDTYSNKPT